MRRALRWLFGIVCLLLAMALALWLGYNVFVERQPETEGLSPLPAALFTLGLFYVGIRQVRIASRSE